MLCRVCDATDFSLALDLGHQPWGNHFLKKEEVGMEPFYPLKVIYCHRCKTAQLDYTIKKETVFTEHTYLSGTTRTLPAFFEKIAKRVDERFFSGKRFKSVLDIGSNDGTQLKSYQKLGYDVLGVESAKKIANIAQINGIPTLNEFYNLKTAHGIGKQFDLINASGVFFHLEELHSVTDAIRFSLKENGVFIVQFLYMKTIMENVAFDQIYHEHLLYYTLETLDRLLQLHGLELFDAEWFPVHGGSIVGYIGHQGKRQTSAMLSQLKEQERISGCNELAAYRQLAMDTEASKEKNERFFEKNRGKRVYGMGAPVKGNTLLNYFCIGSDRLECLVEKNELRRNLFSPGMHLPIRMENEIEPPDIYYVLAWNFKNEILQNNRQLMRLGVEFYFPINPNCSPYL